MGWAIAGGVLGLILMFGSYRYLTGWATARSGGVSIPTIGTRPRRLAGLPEEAPDDAKLPPAMEILRQAGRPIVVDPAGVVEAEDPAASPADDTAAPSPTSGLPEAGTSVQVSAINQGTEDQGEFVVVSNSGPGPVSLEGWKLTDASEKHVYEFPATLLGAESSLRVHMWRGEDTETDLFVGRRSSWWSDDGDTAHLYDAAGNLVHSLTIGATASVASGDDLD